MPLTALVIAARHADAETARSLLADPLVDPNETCLVEAPVIYAGVGPWYRTTPLFEAVRARAPDVVDALLARPDLDANAPVTPLRSTAFCDAVSRGDVEMAEHLLLAGGPGRVDAAAGNELVAHPALYAAMTGHVPLLDMFARRGLVTDELELPLLRTAAANGCMPALHWVQNHFIDARPLSRLTPGQALVKIRRVFVFFDDDGNGFVDFGELRPFLAALGLPLGDDELREAFMALNTAGDNRIDLDELTAYILGPQEYRAALIELGATRGYGGYQVAAARQFEAPIVPASSGGGGGDEGGGGDPPAPAGEDGAAAADVG